MTGHPQEVVVVFPANFPWIFPETYLLKVSILLVSNHFWLTRDGLLLDLPHYDVFQPSESRNDLHDLHISSTLTNFPLEFPAEHRDRCDRWKKKTAAGLLRKLRKQQSFLMPCLMPIYLLFHPSGTGQDRWFLWGASVHSAAIIRGYRALGFWLMAISGHPGH